MPAKGVDHGSNGRGLSSARVIKVEHALDGARLETIHERTRVGVERPVRRTSGTRALGLKVDDMVRRLRAFAIRVDRTNGIVALCDGGNLSWGCIRLNGMKAINANVGGLGLADVNAKSEGYDLSDVCVWAKDADRDAQALTEETHGLETFLVVGSTSTNKDLDRVSDQLTLELLEGTDDALEGGSDVGKVGNTTTNDEDFALGVGSSASDEVDCVYALIPVHSSKTKELTDSFSVFVSLSLCRSTRILSIVGKLVSKPVGRDGIGIHDTGTTTRNHSPDPALCVQDGKFERSTSRAVQFLDVSFLLGEITTERSWPDLIKRAYNQLGYKNPSLIGVPWEDHGQQRPFHQSRWLQSGCKPTDHEQ